MLVKGSERKTVPDEIDPLTAYESPPATGLLPGAEVHRAKPLKTPCLIAAILGAGGLLMGLLAGGGLLFGTQVQSAFAPVPGTAPGEMVEIQQQMQAELNEIQHRFFAVNATLVVLHLSVAGCLLVGAVRCQRRLPSGPGLLKTACWMASVFEIVRAAVQLPIQLQTMSTTDFYIELMFDSSGNMPAQVLWLSTMFTRAVMYASLLLGVVWVLAKVLFYAYLIRRLRQPEVRAALDGSQET